MIRQKGFTLPEIMVILVALFGIGGWIANIVKIVGMSFDSLSGIAVARIAGIFVAPLGAVLGYF